MKNHLSILLIFMLWASAASAQQAASGAKGAEPEESMFEGLIGPTYNLIRQDGSSRAAEYNYLHSSGGGDLRLEYDPLPQRFDIETHYLNQKDYFSTVDYAYRDVLVINGLGRGMFHNLDHLSFGPLASAPPSPTFTDLNPNDQYGIENQLNKVFIRFKTPDFPFHLYADTMTIDRNGTAQQMFLRGYTGGLDKVSQSRDIDWRSKETRAGVNSHFGPVEFDYSHSQKTFVANGDKVLSDEYLFPLMTVPHNEVSDLKSSTDTVKLHTALTGRFVASATYSNGKKENEDSDAKSRFHNSAGDITITPVGGLVLAFKYRHYDISQTNPDTVTLAGLGNTYTVRDALSSKRDVGSGTLRFRLTERMTVKGEYSIEAIERSIWEGTASEWDLAHRTTKTTEKLGVSYRIMSKLSLRADYSAQQVANPAYADDPDRVDTAKTTITWTPGKRVVALLGYGGTQEKRTYLTSPLAGGNRKSTRDQALGSLTFLVGNRTSLTASYLYYKNRTAETLTFTDAAGMLNLENSVPYGDNAQVYSLSASQALGEGVTLTADGSKSFSNGKFRVDGSVPSTTGIDSLSDMKVVEDIYSAGLEIQFTRTIGGEVRYQHRRYEDKIDNTQNGKVSTALATLSAKW